MKKQRVPNEKQRVSKEGFPNEKAALPPKERLLFICLMGIALGNLALLGELLHRRLGGSLFFLNDSARGAPELAERVPERSSELRELRWPEQDEGDGQNNDQAGYTNVVQHSMYTSFLD